MQIKVSYVFMCCTYAKSNTNQIAMVALMRDSAADLIICHILVEK